MFRFRFLVTLGVIFAVLISMQVYLFRGFTEWLDTFPLNVTQILWTQRIVLAMLIYFNISIPARLLIRVFAGRKLRRLKYLFIFPGTTWLISMIMMFVFFVAKDIALAVAEFLRQQGLDVGTRRELLQMAGTFSIGAPLVLTGYGALKTARDYRVEEVEIPFPNLPSGLDGFTIAQVSDIHSGIYMTERQMEEILEIINSLHPQMAALTGDFVDSLAEEIAPVARVFSRIRSDFGIFGCMGNHDLFDNYAKLSQALKDSGIVMLENDNRVLKVNGDQLNVLGIADAGRHYDLSRPDLMLKGVDPHGFKVLLAHRPSFFQRARMLNIDLQLSGHTHGGQIGLNVMGIPINLAHLFLHYTSGLYDEGRSKLYVNPGVGMVFAPVRLSVPPEITLIKLRRLQQQS